jgi:hypothetical protein
MAIENIGDLNRVQYTNPARGLTVRTYDGVTLRVERTDHFAPRERAEGYEHADVRVRIKDSYRSPAAVDVTIVFSCIDFDDRDTDYTCRRLHEAFETRVIRCSVPKAPHLRNITFTLWKNCGDHLPRIDLLLHILDVTLPMTEQIRRKRARSAASHDGAAHAGEWAA